MAIKCLFLIKNNKPNVRSSVLYVIRNVSLYRVCLENEVDDFFYERNVTMGKCFSLFDIFRNNLRKNTKI